MTDDLQATIAARRKHIRDSAPCESCGVADLPTKPKKLRKLAELARHYSACPVRRAAEHPDCCGGNGRVAPIPSPSRDYAAVPCPDPKCPVGRPCTCPSPVVPEWTLS